MGIIELDLVVGVGQFQKRLGKVWMMVFKVWRMRRYSGCCVGLFFGLWWGWGLLGVVGDINGVSVYELVGCVYGKGVVFNI